MSIIYGINEVIHERKASGIKITNKIPMINPMIAGAFESSAIIPMKLKIIATARSIITTPGNDKKGMNIIAPAIIPQIKPIIPKVLPIFYTIFLFNKIVNNTWNLKYISLVLFI